MELINILSVYYYKEKRDGTLSLLRVFGESPDVWVPEQIDGRTVTEIGPYCFSKSCRFSETEVRKNVSGMEEEKLRAYIREQSGNYIQRVRIPDSVTRIANCAFYNCTSLKEIDLTSGVEEIGSDAFMNCIRLERLMLRADVEERTALKQMLAQISWNVEVHFLGKVSGAESPRAVCFFPEYFEGYDEIGPAHVFELNISGEGFRARQCFQDNRILLKEYDDIFPYACVGESQEVLCRYAWNRLAYPAGLTEENKKIYGNYIREHQKDVGRKLLTDSGMEQEQRLFLMECLIREGYLGIETVDAMISLAAEKDRAELSASLLTWRGRYFRKKSSRYAFEEFE